MDPLGTHLLIELKACDADLLDDLDYVRSAVVEAANEAGATIVGDTFHKFQPVGVTGIVAIAESHIGIHTWPEFSYAAADIFTCGKDFRPYQAADLLVRKFHSKQPTITSIRRGLVVPLTTAAV